MLDKDTVIKIKNRSLGKCGYYVSDLGIRRVFYPEEVKEVTMGEILKMSYGGGGRKILEKNLIILNKEAVAEILGDVEPEYYYTKEEVKKLLLYGTLDQLKDCLDFADEGVIELVKTMAVQLDINDLAKRKAIKDKTHFDVTKAVEVNEWAKEDENAEETKTARRSAPITNEEVEAGPARRSTPVMSEEVELTPRKVDPPKYKVIEGK